MEPSDCHRELTPASHPSQISEVSMVLEGSNDVLSSGGESDLKEQEEDTELDSLELHGTLSDSVDREGQRPDMHMEVQRDEGLGEHALGDGNTSCDSGTASIDDARSPPAVHDSAVESLPAVLDGEFECSDLEEPAEVVPESEDVVSVPQNSQSNSNMNPYDTDCSRKLLSEIQRSLSQESLLDELEDELLNSQSDGMRKGSPPNGLQKDQNSMVLFEKCVQYKYSQQEKAIKRLLDENKKHQELILGICSEKDNMRDELKKRMETEKQHLCTIKKVMATINCLCVCVFICCFFCVFLDNLTIYLSNHEYKEAFKKHCCKD
ncbi:coiled-coil domain-containing protein 186-like isoform X2 [Sinocyclocheilus grahami]|uniref:coiled-coil domain-containing protein 186-like isoform X2 n=1 Tax=Sinocyclocheilus grahami TaxID=75366 RepID=UPI0007ACC1DC|nr:PREDICTED: coiled-coil domain-containing protein 186-like isoform X2 [Sinocyclocheilus grahami]